MEKRNSFVLALPILFIYYSCCARFDRVCHLQSYKVIPYAVEAQSAGPSLRKQVSDSRQTPFLRVLHVYKLRHCLSTPHSRHVIHQRSSCYGHLSVYLAQVREIFGVQAHEGGCCASTSGSALVKR